MTHFWQWTRDNRRLAITITASVVWLYAIGYSVVAPDMTTFLFPWFAHIAQQGPINAFATPFSNYTPPYLYLMAAASLATTNAHLVVKALAILGAICVAAALSRLLRGNSRRHEAAMMSFLIPTIVINAVIYGQCDGYWTSACLMCVVAASERRHAAMLTWIGIAFAFKAQAASPAPFVAAIVLQRRVSPAYLLIPPAIYTAAILPAWLAGWPAADLATIYLRQAQYFNTVGTAPNPWAIVALVAPREPSAWFLIGYIVASCAAVMYVITFARRSLVGNDLLRAALLSAMIVPFLLPKMHERFTLLADLLSFALAFSIGDRRSWRICLLVIGASTIATFGAMFEGSAFLLLPAAASAINGTAIMLVFREIMAQSPQSLHSLPSNLCN